MYIHQGGLSGGHNDLTIAESAEWSDAGFTPEEAICMSLARTAIHSVEMGHTSY